MMLRLSFILLAGFCSAAFTQYVAPPSANSYMDTVLNTSLLFESKSRYMDPAAVPDFRSDFQDRVAILGKVKGHVNYTNGKLYGLSKARRSGQCLGPTTVFNRVSINCTVSLDNLTINYAGKLKYGKMPTASISANGNMSSTLMYVGAQSFSRSAPYIADFKFTKIGEVQGIKFSGLGPGLNKYMKVLEDDFRQQTWRIIYNKIAIDFQNMLNQSFAKVAFPW